jgi:hypothetical protein
MGSGVKSEYTEVKGIFFKPNDFDLAHVRGKTRPSGTERTGTMPFMALDLLTKEAWEGKVERLYRASRRSDRSQAADALGD